MWSGNLVVEYYKAFVDIAAGYIDDKPSEIRSEFWKRLIDVVRIWKKNRDRIYLMTE